MHIQFAYGRAQSAERTRRDSFLSQRSAKESG